MLSKTTLADESVQTYYDMMTWISSQYGPPVKQSVPKIVKPDPPLHQRCWADDDPRTVFAWANAEIHYLAQICGMQKWSVQIAPSGERAQNQAAHGFGARIPLKSNAWQEGEYPGYFIDQFGRPTFFYDPRRCVEEGYLAGTILPNFAKLKIFAKKPPTELAEKSMNDLTYMMMCHLGLGFNMLALAQLGRSEKWTPLALLHSNQPDESELPLLYGTLMTLTAHRLTPEQIIATYGKLMSQRTRKLLRPALEQIEAQTDQLKLLRMLSAPTHSAGPAHSHPHQAQLSDDLGELAQGAARQ